MKKFSPSVTPLPLEQFDVIRGIIEEHRRSEFRKILNWFIGGFSVAIVVFIWDAFNNARLNPIAFLQVLLVSLIVPVIATWQIDQAYRRFFTSILAPEFIKRFNLQDEVELNYSLLAGISESTFNSCGLFPQTTDYKSSGRIKGMIGKTSFECATIMAQEIHQNFSQNRKQKNTIFNGLFFIADANKNFQGTTFIVPDVTEAILGQTGHSLQSLFARRRFGRCELVSLEDPDFESNFAVYSSDQIEARYLLTPLMMQQITAIFSSWKSPLHIAFIYGKIFLAINTPQNWLSPPAVFIPANAASIRLFHDKILQMLQLVDNLGLNTRIWGRG